MPQLTAFPHLGAGPPNQRVEELIAAICAIPEAGEPFKDLRARLRRSEMWHKDRYQDLLRFFRLPEAKTVEPSEVVRQLQEAEDEDGRRVAMADRLWESNPLLFYTVLTLVAERPHTREDFAAYVQSFAYRGENLPPRSTEAWLQLALGLGILKLVGIAFLAGPLADQFADRAKIFDVDEFIEEDEPEPELIAEAGPAGADDEAGDEAGSDSEVAGEVAGAAAAARAPEPARPVVSYSTPLGRNRPVVIGEFAGAARFSTEVVAETRERIDAWWAEQSAEPSIASAEDFGLGADTWMEGADEALYRMAVAAALSFRLGRPRTAVVDAYRGLDRAGVLADLYFGTAPDSLPAAVDSQALMLASLVARRCAESPDLAVTLEKQKSAVDAFGELEKALGRGLFSMELFWIMRALGEIGALRLEDMHQVSALPTRLVRDTLYRLGFLATPYASDPKTLLEAARAAGSATSSPTPDVVLEGFALAAGCQYDCPHRRTCDYACRERAEITAIGRAP